MNTEQNIKLLASHLYDVTRGLELTLLNLSSEPREIRSSDRQRMSEAASRLPELLDSLQQLKGNA